ncbi:MAG: hypothetical protein FWF57_04230 [Defluviitaleaceae bacterium]|nr:hypothetical protein [Defluviitaleaceae bacterium]
MKKIKKAVSLGVLAVTTVTAMSVVSHAGQSTPSNIELLQEVFDESNIRRARNGIYTVTLEGNEVPNVTLPINFKILDHDTIDNTVTLNLTYRPLRISINPNNSQQNERIRLSTLLNRGDITERQFNYLMSSLNQQHKIIPPSLQPLYQQPLQ